MANRTSLSNVTRINNSLSWRPIFSSVIFSTFLLITGAEAVPTPTSAIPDPAWLREKLESVRQATGVPALAAAIVYRGDVVAASVVGVRKMGDSTPAQRDDGFQIGSITKSLTSTLVARCVEQHLISWNTTLDAMFPELVATMNPAYPKVTVAQLLSHTSGMPYQPVTPESVTDTRGGGDVLAKRYEYVKAAVIDPPLAPPGTKYIYGGGPVLVACFLERKLNKPYEELLREQVFEPLGMTHSGFGDAATPGQVDAPWQHEGGLLQKFVPVEPDPVFSRQARSPVGRNVYCSVIDLAHFAALHLNGAHGRTRYLSPETFRQLIAPQPGAPNYGLGWCLTANGWAGKNIIWHNGSNGHNYAVMTIGLDRDFAVVVMTNSCSDATNNTVNDVQYFLGDIIARSPGLLKPPSSAAKAP